MTHSFPTRRSSDFHNVHADFDGGTGVRPAFAGHLCHGYERRQSVRPRSAVRSCEQDRCHPALAHGHGRLRRVVHVPAVGQLSDGHTNRGRSSNRSEEHTSELQSLMRISYAVFCLKKKTHIKKIINTTTERTQTYTHYKAI